MGEDISFLSQYNGLTNASLLSLLEFSDAIISILDPNGNYLYANQALPGFKKEEIIGQPMYNFLPENLSSQVRNNIEKVVSSGNSVNCQHDFFGQEGVMKLYNHVMNPVKTKEGNIQAIIMVSSEIHVKAEKTDISNDERLRNLYREMPAMFHSIDVHGRIIGVSNEWLKVLGYQEKEVIGKKSTEFLTEASCTYAKTVILPDFFVKGYCTNVPYQFIKKNGEIIEVLLSATSEKDASGQVVRSMAVMVDVTEKQALILEKERRESVLRNLINATAGKRAEEYFEALVMSLGSIIRADKVFIGRMSDNKQSIDTIAHYYHGQLQANFSYDLQDTPCQNTLNETTCVYENNVAEHFPQDKGLRELNIQAYLGTTIRNKKNELIGIIVALFEHPLKDTLYVRSLFELLSGSVGSEMERMDAEWALKESEQKLKHIANSVPGAMLVYKLHPDNTEEILFLSDQAEGLWEVKKEKALANPGLLWARVLKDDLPELNNSIKKSAVERSFWNHEWRIRTKRGKVKWLNGRGVPKKQAGGGIVWDTLILDITERKKAEASFFKAYDLLEKSSEAARIGTWEVDVISMQCTVNKVTQEIHEVDDDFPVTLDRCFAFYKEGMSRNTIHRAFSACIELGEKFDIELQMISARNNEKWVRVIGIPVMEKEKCVRIYGLFQDIDEKTKAGKQLAFQEELFRKTLENAPNGIAMVDLNGHWFQMNESFCKILGYTKEELLPLSFLDITHPDEKKDNGRLFKAMAAGKQESFQTEKRYIHKNGSTVWATLSVAAVKNDRGQTIHFVYQINDITQKKLVQIQLQEHINRLQSILDASTQVGIIETDAKGIIKIFNKGAENLLGYTPDEVVEKCTPEIFHQKEDIRKCKEKFSGRILMQEPFQIASKQGGKEFFHPREWTYVRKNGSTFPGLLSLTPTLNAKKEINGTLQLITDLTLIKKAEKEIKSLLDVTQAQNKRLLNFAHIVSHNLRSHTANFSMILDLMQSENSKTTDGYFFQLLKTSSDNLRETISHLNEVVAMNSITKENLSTLNLYHHVEKSIADVKMLAIDANCTIHNQVNQKLMVKGIPAYLESIILNMLTNAIKYRSSNRKPAVYLTSEPANKYVVLKVKDNGLGIDMKLHSAKLFGMYKTFHENKDARGIGLFITKNQVEAMGGKIEVESTVNQGSTFKIYLLHEKV